jgi:hypothetical protein
LRNKGVNLRILKWFLCEEDVRCALDAHEESTAVMYVHEALVVDAVEVATVLSSPENARKFFSS